MFVNQPNMQSPEELASLFSKNMTLDPIRVPQEEPKIVYISQHYTHSAHVAKQPVEPPQLSPRPASEPPQSEYELVNQVLRNHGVDPSGLSASQLQLFKTADTPQQVRLVELWRICPPTNSSNNPALAWNFTTVEQEEALAKLRYDQQQQQETESVMSLDGTPLTPIQSGDGRWIGIESQTQHYMEPYMTSGYEDMARREYEESARRAIAEASFQGHKGAVLSTSYRKATDPVYNSTVSPCGVEQQMQMANQYGRMVALRMDDEEML
jgi:hypothetical protein